MFVYFIRNYILLSKSIKYSSPKEAPFNNVNFPSLLKDPGQYCAELISLGNKPNNLKTEATSSEQKYPLLSAIFVTESVVENLSKRCRGLNLYCFPRTFYYIIATI